MKKLYFLALIVGSLIISGTGASAATNPNTVLKGFQTYVANAKSTLARNKIQYDSSVGSINTMYSNSESLAKTTYNNEISSAKNAYEPQIDAAAQVIKDAKIKLLTVNQVKVLKQGNNRDKWGYFNCPSARLDCKYVDKGELFVIGEVTTLKAFVGDNIDYLTGVQSMLDEGLIELINVVEYQNAVRLIKTEPGKIETFTTLWDVAIASASAKQTLALDVARLTASRPLITLVENYEIEKASLENQISAGNMAIRAAKRASKNPSAFDKAFVTAFKFEYNVKELDSIANLSFASLNTLRSFLSQYAVIELADKAAGVDASYSYLAAEKINKSVSNVFTVDEEFREPAKLVVAQYKKLAKVTLKF